MRSVAQYLCLSIPTVFKLLDEGKKDITYPGLPGPCNLESMRLSTFRHNGIICRGCGLMGNHFSMCMHNGSKLQLLHLNLFAINDRGHEILMTKDHILARSKGGPDILENLQTMCANCNMKKKDTIPEDLPDILKQYIGKDPGPRVRREWF